MLSYRHAFHAGNAGDVLKHAVVSIALGELLRKDKPLSYLETHAGAGLYDLAGARTRKTGEAETGIGRLWLRSDVPACLHAYLDAVRALNPDGVLRRYPGSPLVAARLLRPSDRIVLMELHPEDHAALRAALRDDRRAHVHRRNGGASRSSTLPTSSRPTTRTWPSAPLRSTGAGRTAVSPSGTPCWRASLSVARSGCSCVPAWPASCASS